MMNHSFFSQIFQREIGSSACTTYQGVSLCNPQPGIKLSQPNKIIKISTSPSISSEIVWLSGKQNILITLNTHGQVFCYNLINPSWNFQVTSHHEQALKVFFAGDCLFMAVKTNYEEFIQFSLTSIESLQLNNPIRNSVLKNLSVTTSNLKEFHISSSKIVVESRTSIQIWDILSDELYRSFPLHPQISYQYTKNYFVFWEPSKTETKFGIFNLLSPNFIQFSLKTSNKIYFCRVIENVLILGIQDCSFHGIDLSNMRSIIIYDKIPKILIEFEDSESFFTVFQDNSCMINFENEKIMEMEGGEGVIACEIDGWVCFCNGNGDVGRIWDGKVEVCGKVEGVEQMGKNLDSGEVYLACREGIFVYD
jgi:hypothetical protein